MTETFLILRISKLWHPEMSDEELYDTTRMWWVATLAKASTASRVLAVANGEVKEVYEPARWMPSPERGLENRIGFEGRVAVDRDRWVGADVASLFKPGAANPVTYVDTTVLDRIAHRAESPAIPTKLEPPVAEQPLVEQGLVEEPGLVERVLPLLDAFESDPIFAMSRAGQELFHSNMLGWLIEHVPAVGSSILSALGVPLENSTHCKVWREKGNLDLLVRTPRGLQNLVVENKLYALPSEEQLKRYLAKKLPWCDKPGRAGAPDTRYVLLSQMEPTFPLPAPWAHVSYHQLAEAMFATPVGGLGEHVMIIERYVGLLRRLSELSLAIDPRQNLDEPFSAADLDPTIKDRRFDGPLQKMRYTGLVQDVARRVGRPLPFAVDITRAKGLATFQARLTATRWVGWQLQESQLRLFVLIQDRGWAGKGDALKLERAAVAERDHADWFDFSVAEKLLGEQLSVVGDPMAFKHFDPDFVYRYRKVHPSVTSRDLAEVLAALTVRTIQFSGQ